MASKRKPLGARVTVLVGSKKTSKGEVKNFYSAMLKATADYYGFKIVSAPISKPKDKKREGSLLRGSIGAGSIKVPFGKAATVKGSTKSVQKYKSIPIPAGASNSMIKKFLQGATKNKPEKFVSKDGRTYPVTVAKASAPAAK